MRHRHELGSIGRAASFVVDVAAVDVAHPLERGTDRLGWKHQLERAGPGTGSLEIPDGNGSHRRLQLGGSRDDERQRGAKQSGEEEAGTEPHTLTPG